MNRDSLGAEICLLVYRKFGDCGSDLHAMVGEDRAAIADIQRSEYVNAHERPGIYSLFLHAIPCPSKTNEHPVILMIPVSFLGVVRFTSRAFQKAKLPSVTNNGNPWVRLRSFSPVACPVRPVTLTAFIALASG